MNKYDLIVVGGGISGIATAVSAAREGLKVLLIEKGGTLGGAMSYSLVYPFMIRSVDNQPFKFVNAGIFNEMLERHKNYGEVSYETYKFVFDDMLCEAGVDVLFHSTVFKVDSNNRKIKSVSVSATAGIIEFFADYFIDATGDGELIAMSGCEFQLGRESDGLCQPMTTCFRVAGVDTNRFKEEYGNLQQLYKEKTELGLMKNPRENILSFLGLGGGIVHFNTTRIIEHDSTNVFELSRAEMLGRRQVSEFLEFMRENSKAFKDARLVSIANTIGVRESRKLKGEYILTGDDLISCRKFEDAIALGCYEIDIHNPTGSGTHLHYFKNGEYYQIPYRSLLPKEYDNMLVVGRCLSADHVAHSAVRIMPICACMGQAAGIAVALAKKSDKNMHIVNVNEVREILIKNGAVL